MSAFNKFKSYHFLKKKFDGLRMGQRFHNMFIKSGYDELFYCDDQRAEILIKQYLSDNQYTDTLPRLNNHINILKKIDELIEEL